MILYFSLQLYIIIQHKEEEFIICTIIIIIYLLIDSCAILVLIFWIAELKCSGFPGPGAEGRVSANPMSEFINNDDTHVHEMFHHFKRRHGKQYKTQKEEYQRKAIFKHNIRSDFKMLKLISFSIIIMIISDKKKQKMF